VGRLSTARAVEGVRLAHDLGGVPRARPLGHVNGEQPSDDGAALLGEFRRALIVIALEDAHVEARDRLGAEGRLVVSELVGEAAERPDVDWRPEVASLAAADAAAHAARAHNLGREIARRAAERVKAARLRVGGPPVDGREPKVDEPKALLGGRVEDEVGCLTSRCVTPRACMCASAAPTCATSVAAGASAIPVRPPSFCRWRSSEPPEQTSRMTWQLPWSPSCVATRLAMPSCADACSCSRHSISLRTSAGETPGWRPPLHRIAYVFTATSREVLSSRARTTCEKAPAAIGPTVM